MSESRDMNDLVRLARLPWSMFTTGLDFMWRVSLPPGFYERFGERGESREERGGRSSRENEGWRRSFDDWSEDLSGDDVKLVRYKLLFTRRGQEKVLETGEELVAYSTTAAAFGANRIARYMRNHADSESISEDDQRYLKVNVRVVDRFPKESVDYDGRMVDLMERQVELIGSLDRQVSAMNAGQRRVA